MKKTMKKILASVIAAAMILTAAPLSGIAQLDLSGIFAPKASALDEGGQLTETISWRSDSWDGHIIIEGSGRMPDYNDTDNLSPFYGSEDLEYVRIEGEIENIGAYMFKNCTELYGVDYYPSYITSIGAHAFEGCTRFHLFGDYGITTVGEYAFLNSGCCHFENVTDIGKGAFENSQYIMEVAFNEALTVIREDTFKNSLITGVRIPASVTKIEDNAFYNCKYLNYVFYDGTQEQWNSIDIGTGNEVLFGNASPWATSGQLSDTVSWSLDEVNGSRELTISGTGYMPDYPEFFDEGVATNPFINKDIDKIIIENGITGIGAGAFARCSAESVEIRGELDFIGCSAFFDSSLKSIDLSTVSKLQPMAFYNSDVKDVILGDRITELSGEVFGTCELNELDFSKNTEIIFGYAFGYANTVRFESGFNGQFYWLCCGTAYLPSDMPELDERSFETVSEIYYEGTRGQWKELTSFYDKNHYDYLEDKEGERPYVWIEHCTVHCLGVAETSGEFCDGVFWSYDESSKTLTMSGNGELDLPRNSWGDADYSTKNYLLAEFEIDNVVVEEGITRIGCYVFSGTPIKNITLPSTVEIIESFTFYFCSDLVNIYLPEGIEQINNNAFYYCSSLTDVYYAGSPSQWNAITIGDNNTSLTNATIHYGKYDASGALSDTVSYTYDKDTGVLTISGTGAIPTYVSASASPFAGREFSKIIIEEGITEIGSYVFPNCDIGTLSTPITLDNVKDNAFVGSTADNIIVNYYLGEDSAFDAGETGNEMLADPSSFEEYFYEIVTDTITACYIGKTMGLTYSGTGAIPDYSSEEWGTFSGTGEVHSVVFEEGITHIGDYSLVLCNGIESIILPDSLESIGEYAFALDTGLKTVTIGKNLTEIGLAAFTGCYSLEAFNVSADNTAFCSVDGVLYSKDRKELVLYPAGKEDTEFEIPAGTETLCAAAFAECDNLTKVTIPISVTEIDKGVFNGMDALTDVYYLGTQAEWDNITMGDINTSLRDVTMHYVIGGKITDTTSWTYNEETQTLTITGTGDSKISYNYNGETYDFEIKNVVIDTEAYSGDYEYVFDNFCNAVSFRFTSKVSDIDVSETGVCFCNFYKLKSFIVDEDNSVYESIDGVLFDSVNNTLLVYPIGKSGSVYTVPDGTVAIGDFAFMASYITEVILPDSLESIGYLAFNLCWNLSSIDLNNVKYVDDQAFLSCYSLSDVDFGNNLESIGGEAFYGTALKNVVIPASVKELWSLSFGSLELESVTFEEGFDFCNNKTQGSGELCNVFDGSTISKLYLPSSITNVYAHLFRYCDEIQDVYFNGTAAEWAEIGIGDGNEVLANADIHFLKEVDAFTEDSGIEVQTVDGIVYANGFNPGTTVDEISAMTADGWTVSVETADGSDRIGTGSVITMTNDSGVTVEYVVVIYGDTTGDSWYDGQDALITSCMVNGMLDETTAGAAVTSAADCNHDGVVDDLDVEILRQAGVLLASVDQTKSEEELIATSSAYVEYLNLIDQTVEKEKTEVVEEEPVDPGYTFSFFDMILNLIKEIITVINSVIAFFK